MRFKVVPPAPESLSILRAVQQAVPLVPGSEEDCCARVMRSTTVASRDRAREWLTFVRALGLVDESDGRFYRVREDPADEELADRFRERVYAVEEILAVLREADAPLDAAEVFDRVRSRVPAWERQRSADWEETWRERVGRLLDWAVLFGLASARVDGYVARDGDGTTDATDAA